MERWMESVRDAPAYFVFDDDPEGLEEWEREQQRASGRLKLTAGETRGGAVADGIASSHSFLPLPVDAQGRIIHGKEESSEEMARQTPTDDLPWGLCFILGQVPSKGGSMDYKSILLDAKPHRSKWYDPSRPGQGELYDGLERVLLDLKAFTPHSLPFLHRVSKKDVPDYHLIIKSPMDLGTMAKKLKEHEYQSKAEFCRDLNLIYDNCMQYNQQEESPLRTAVRLLREKWTLLLNKVPDIIIGGDTITISSSVEPTIEQDSAVLEEELLIVSSSDIEDTDNTIAEDVSRVELKWPPRSCMLMGAFRRRHNQHQPEAEAADLALFCNAFPDTWTIDSRNHNNSFYDKLHSLGVKTMLECVWLHQGEQSKSVDPQILNCNRVETGRAARRVSLKIAGLILAAHGCDATPWPVLYILRDLLDTILKEACLIFKNDRRGEEHEQFYNRRTDHDTLRRFVKETVDNCARFVDHQQHYKQRLERARVYQEELLKRLHEPQVVPFDTFTVPPRPPHDESLSDVELSDEAEYLLTAEEVAALRESTVVESEPVVEQSTTSSTKKGVKRTKSVSKESV